MAGKRNGFRPIPERAMTVALTISAYLEIPLLLQAMATELPGCVRLEKSIF
jgi:hypothetical protein